MEHDRPSRVVRWMGIVIGRPDPAALGVVLPGQVLPEPLPLVPPVAGDGQPAVPALAVRREGRYLEGDVALHVAENQVMRRHLPEHGPFEEVLGAFGLGHAEATQVRRGARLVGNGTHGIDHAVLRIFVEYGTVAAVLQHDFPRLLALHRDLLGDDAQGLPSTPPPHHVRLVGVEFLHVHVVHVDPREGESPGDPVVMAGVHTHEGRLAGTDHVPARGVQMGIVPQRGVLQAAMGVVDDHDLARDGQGAAHGPVVAADLE